MTISGQRSLLKGHLLLNYHFRENLERHLVLPPDWPHAAGQRLHVRVDHHQAVQARARETEAQLEVTESKE